MLEYFWLSVLERWPVLILCIAVAAVASLVSARFANRVDSRTVGLVIDVIHLFSHPLAHIDRYPPSG